MKSNDTFLFSVPAVAAYGGSHAPKAIVSIVILIGVGKCIAIAKREKTSSKCVYALMLALFGWFLATLYPIIKPMFSAINSSGWIHVGAILILEIGAACVAIIGLAGYRRGHYVQGKKQAIWTILISVFMLSSMAFGFYQGYGHRSPALADQKVDKKKIEYRVYNDLNFKFAFPGKPYIEMNVNGVNPDATFAIMRSNPHIYFMIIAERAGVDLDIDTKGLCEINKANLQSSATKVKFINEEEFVLNDMKGICLHSDVKALNRKFAYVQWLYSHNGYLY